MIRAIGGEEHHRVASGYHDNELAMVGFGGLSSWYYGYTRYPGLDFSVESRLANIGLSWVCS